jgi:Flp pilus assembly secretin CpaC
MFLLIVILSMFGQVRAFDVLTDINSLYVGEKFRIDATGIKKVEVSNKKVIKVYKSDKKILIIEGKGRGNATLYIWQAGAKEAFKYRFTVLSASVFRRSAGIKDALRGIKGIKVNNTADTVYITGNVDKKEDLDLINKLTNSEKNVVNYVKMEGLGFNQIHNKIIASLLELGLYDVNIRQTDGFMIIEANSRSKKSIEHAEQYIKVAYPEARIDIRYIPYQIDIDVKIVEVNNSDKRELGLETPSEFSVSRHTVLSNIQIDSVLHLYDGRGSAKILSNPSLSSNDGETADFHVGGSIPIKLSSRYSSTMDWKDYGVLLNFTPKVINEDIVELSISSQFSSLDDNNSKNETPSLLIRGVKTVVTMDSGRSVVISGLVSRINSKTTGGLPIISDVPVLSDIFANNSSSNNSTELAVIVTPSIRLNSEELFLDKKLESLLIETLNDGSVEL